MNQYYFDDRLCYCFDHGMGLTSLYDYVTDDFGNSVALTNETLAQQHIFLELEWA